ncbi:hypothetical protein V5799_015890 [Amblyomma americanum]|uniref:Peptidase M13 N-terminal domain-containing protein n=1 Tax=Amblyomma americanum TaxID=6943 RepID=A0AAQ4F6L0_AMBAM
MAAVLALLTCAVGATLIIIFWLRGDGPPDDMYCDSADCRHHEALIGARLNRSINPCDDFGAFVCSAWMTSSAYHRGSPSTQQDVVDAWSMRFESILQAGLTQLKAPGEKAFEMFRLCKELPTSAPIPAIEALRKFMDNHNISWPQQPLPSARPLALLLDLELSWGVTLWFHVRNLRKQGKRERALIVRPAKRISDWLQLHRELVASGGFFDYWRRLFELLAPPGTASATENESRRVADVQTAVLQKLLDAGRTPSPAQVLLKDIEKNITSIPSQEWIALLNKNLRTEPTFAGEDRIIVTHSALVDALDEITRTYGNMEIVDSLAWLFVQAFAPATDIGLLAPARANATAAAAGQHAAFCAARVESAYRFLIISLFTLLNFSNEERREIDTRLRAIRGAAADKVAAAGRLDQLSKRRAQEKLNETTTQLWPIAELLDKTAISIMYTSFPDDDTSFVALWLRTLTSLRGLSRSYVHDETLYLPANLALPLLDYDYVLNDIRISMQALSPPVFYLQGTHAMFYGGLGFLYASQLVRALDSRGMRIGSDAQVAGLWLSSTWRHAATDVDSCLGAGESHFPEIPALEVSYGALEQALGQSDDLHQRLRDGFTERQLFFITLCFLMCSRPGTNPMGNCNKAVMNFPPFAHEFGCATNSKMKPAKYCPFFDQGVM